MFLTLSISGFAQASASAEIQARVEVVEPIRINKTLDMNFGNVISGLTAGQLILMPDGSRVVNGVEISAAVPGKVNSAQALVTHGNYSYSVSLPDFFTLYNQEDPNSFIRIDRFTFNPSPSPGLENTDILKIGATLNLKANQEPGYYTNPSGFMVTVSYN